MRRLLQWLVPNASRLRLLSRIGRYFTFLLPKPLAAQVPKSVTRGLRKNTSGTKQVLLLQGCAQQVTTGGVNEVLQSVLGQLEIGVVTAPNEGCCGSLDLHLGDEAKTLKAVRNNVNAFFPLLDRVDAIVSTASGCGVTVKDYGRLLADDSNYADRAAQVAAATVDVGEYLTGVSSALQPRFPGKRIAWHPPCSLQHGQQLEGIVETLLTGVGYELLPVTDAHLCCGSAGTYSVLQPQWSTQLRSNKLQALQQHQPDLIATANVGCQVHLADGTDTPVLHWIELLT